MTDPAGSAGPADALLSLRERVGRDLARLDQELAEIELLVQQARAEAGRHETKRAAAAERLGALRDGPVAEAVEAANQLVILTRRATVMETQVEVLEGKAKVLHRYRDTVADFEGALDALPDSERVERADDGAADRANTAPNMAVSRIVLSAQEDLRREISRAMHDGPAQSLTNIVLQAQIVDRLLARDPERAREEVRQLVAMVQQTLEATKSFIFDVRPMVLDDLGLVPTLRRAARDRGRRAQVPVEFESFGLDARLPMELETGLFRLLDEALAGFLAGRPDRVDIRLDWNGRLEATVTATREAPAPGGEPAAAAVTEERGLRKRGKDDKGRGRSEPLPEALAAMIEERDAAAAAARDEAARKAAWVPMTSATWREIGDRAAMLGIVAELGKDGTEVRISAEIDAALPVS